MKLFSDLTIKFEEPNWARNPEFGLLDTLLEQHPELIEIVKDDVLQGSKISAYGRGDVPSVEQIMRAALFKELKGITYRELDYAQEDSRICAQFLKLDDSGLYRFETYQKYIARIGEDSLKKLMVEINKIAINNGLENLKMLRQDSTTVKANIHYPTNNSLVWDCIRVAHTHLAELARECEDFHYRSYMKSAKKTYFKINNTKNKDKKVELFQKQLVTFTKTINSLSNAIKKKHIFESRGGMLALVEIANLLPMCRQVYAQTQRHEINGEQVPNEEKIFSIFEPHTDILVKGSRNYEFGHKVDISSGKSNLILDCAVLQGNPSDTELFAPAQKRIIANYGKAPKSLVTDGGYASKKNMDAAKDNGVFNIVFNKIVGSLRNSVSSLNMETRLKKWRSGIEAVISNLKRGFSLDRVTWQGFGHFKAKVLWGVIAYNIKVMTRHILAGMLVV